MPGDAYGTLCGLRLDDGRTWGAAATDLQHDDARAVLNADGPRRHWLGRPRGHAKSQDVAGMLLADLVVGRIARSHPAYVAAGDRGQAGLVLDSIASFVERSGLAGTVEVQTYRAVHRATGARIEVLAADSSGTFGLRPSRLAMDELCMWSDTRQSRRFYEALSTALPKVSGSVLVVSTTAGTPNHWSHKVYTQALAEPDLWRVSMTHEPAPWIARDLIEAERRALTPSAFARLWENRWTQAEDALVSAEDLAAACTLDGPLGPRPGRRYVCTLDVGLVNDRTVAVVAHAEPGPTGVQVIVDQLRCWQGSRRNPVDLDEVTAAVAGAHRDFGARVIADPHQAQHLVQILRKRNVPAVAFDFTAQSVGLLAGALLRALRSRAISLPNDPELRDELLGVRIVENSVGVPRLTHDAQGHDDRAVALALAVHTLTRNEVLSEVPVIRSANVLGRLLPRLRDRHEPAPEPPPAVVRQAERPPPGARRGPGGRIVIPRHHPGYQPPRPR